MMEPKRIKTSPISSNILNDFDVDLQDFFFNVVSKEVDVSKKWKAIGIKRDLRLVINAYTKATVNNFESFIKFDTSAKRCGYLLKHSPLFTSAVAIYFNRLMMKNPHTLDETLRRGILTICCLGGGPASDIVGLIPIIRQLYKDYWSETKKALKLKVHVVDLSEDWLVTAENLLECLKNTPKLIGTDEIEISYRFHTADLTEKINSTIKEAIHTADIVTMIYFLSAVNGSRVKDKSQEMLDNIMLTMKKGAFLFFLDSAADHHYQILNNAATKRNTMQEIFGPLVEEFHTLSLRSVRKFLALYSAYFHRFICMTNIFLAVSSWYKPKEISKNKLVRRTLTSDPESWTTPTEDESDKLTRKMKHYRFCVQQILNEKMSINNKTDAIGKTSGLHSQSSLFPVKGC